MKTEKFHEFQDSDHPLEMLRCSIDHSLYLCHAAESHYVVKLIKLEENKVACPCVWSDLWYP
jgi:hypothetical protein